MKNRKARSVALATALLVALGVLPSVSSPASAAASPTSWLAAGDSYSAGYGLPGATRFPPGPCEADKDNSWPALVRARAGAFAATYDFVACTGAVTEDYFGGAKNQRANGRLKKYDLITMSYGGNDASFAPMLMACVSGSVAGKFNWLVDRVAGCLPDAVVKPMISSLLPRFSSFLTLVADASTTRGGNVVVVGYPALMEEPPRWNATAKLVGLCNGVEPSGASRIRGWAGLLNSVLGQAVAEANRRNVNDVRLTFVNVQDGAGNPGPNGTNPTANPNLFEAPGSPDRHNLCGSDSWMFGLGPGLFHPNQKGHTAEASVVAPIVANLDWSRLGQQKAAPTPAPDGTAATPTPVAEPPPVVPDPAPAPQPLPSPGPDPAPTPSPSPSPSPSPGPTPAPAPPRIALSRGGPAPQGSWYSVSLSGFSPGSSVTTTCRDSVDPGGFYNQTFTIDGNGNASDTTLCYSADGPDHWVTGGGVESNHVTWGGSAPQGYWYSVTLSGFSPGSSVTTTCRDSVDPGGFWNQTFTIDGNGNASDSTLCYSADGPDHWVTGGGVESNHVGW